MQSTSMGVIMFVIAGLQAVMLITGYERDTDYPIAKNLGLAIGIAIHTIAGLMFLRP